VVGVARKVLPQFQTPTAGRTGCCGHVPPVVPLHGSTAAMQGSKLEKLGQAKRWGLTQPDGVLGAMGDLVTRSFSLETNRCAPRLL